MNDFEASLRSLQEPRVEGYRILRPLGEGGQARVYLARDATGRDVAIKRWLDPELDPRERERIRREAAALQQADHPNLARFLAATRDARGAPCLVLELVEGTSLAELIRQAGRLEPRRAAEIGLALAGGLAHLHGLGLVHRDVKPGNVIVRQEDSQPVLIDLGIVKRTAPPAGDALTADLTRSDPGSVLGSYPYAAPEQLGAEAPGVPSAPIDARTDVYGLGALLFEALSGFPPWTHQGPWVRRHRRVWEEPVYPEVQARAKDVPWALRRIVARCLQGDAAARYPTSDALGDDLRAFLAGVDPTGPEEGHAPPQRLLTLAWVRCAADAREALATRVERADGVVLAAEDDWLGVSFEAPSAAVACGLRLLRSPPGDLRLGVHLGEVQGDPPAGPAVELARRLAELAEPGQLLLSAAAFEEARLHLQGEDPDAIAWRAHGRHRLEGLPGGARELELCEVGIPGSSPLAPPAEGPGLRRLGGGPEILGWRPAPGLRIPRRPNWVLARKLGEGGFGEVWVATHASTRDQRAFKFCFHEDRVRQLKREVIVFTILRDTLDKRWDITQILDWQFDEAPFFIESEYSAQGSLYDWARAQGGLAAIDLELRLELVAQVADALAAAHGVGVLHKDVKPSNILIAPFGPAQTAQLADFGVGMADRAGLERVAPLREQITAASLTELLATGDARAYSLLYMAPELIEGEAASKLSDVYALGVVLYQVVRGDFHKALAPGWERHVPDPLLRADIGACVESDPALRLGDSAELAARLRTLDERRVAQRAAERERERAELLQRQQELVRQRRKAFAVVGGVSALALALILALGAAGLGHGEERPTREELLEQVERLEAELEAQRREAEAWRREAQGGSTD